MSITSALTAPTRAEEIRHARLQGIACALAEIYRQAGDPVAIKDVLDGYGLELDHFRRAGVEEYDLTELEQVYVELGG